MKEPDHEEHKLFMKDHSGREAVNPKFVKELLDYNQENGSLIWRKRDRKWFKTNRGFKIFNSSFPGKVTGCSDGKGYLQTRLFNKLYFVHRLIWAWHYGEWPAAGYDIDHIDRNSLNNMIENLRIATRSQNNINRENTKGYTYVESMNKYIAQSSYNYKHYYLGLYNTPEDAKSAYERFIHEKHGTFLSESSQ